MAARSAPIKMGGKQVQQLGDGVEPSDAVNKGQLDAAVGGVDLSGYAPIDSPVLTGNPQAPTPLAGDNDTSIATTAFVIGELGTYAPLDSPTFTGTPEAPTPSQGDNSTKIATTAYADNLPKWSFVPVTSDQSVSGSTSLTDTALTFPVAASKTYAFRAVLDVQMGAGGIRLAANGPASPTRVRIGGGQATSPGGNQAPALVAAYGSLFYTFTSAQVAWIFEIHGVVQNGTNAGSVTLQFAQSASDPANTTIKAGSHLEYREIA